MKDKFDRRNFRALHVLVRKEISDYIRSWRFVILLAIILLTCFGSLYGSLATLRKSVPAPDDPNASFFFLKIFTTSDGSIPPFHLFVGFLGPLLGIGLGFDAVNSEFNNRSISRVLAQPIPRDSFLIAKFFGGLIVISCLFITMLFLTTGFAIIWTGLLPSGQELSRILLFLVLSIVYVGFWLNMSILFSVLFKHPATSALLCIAIWLFFIVFYPLIVSVVAKGIAPSPYASQREIMEYQRFMMTIMRFAPNQLYEDGTNILLTPSVRSLGPLNVEQIQGAIPTPLSVWSSLKIVWSQVTALLSVTIICFALSYFNFMRKEIRA